MGTYPIEKILSDYKNERMDVETATGHSLQHIDELHKTQTAAKADHQALRNRVNELEKTLKTLQTEMAYLQKRPAEVDRLRALENNLTALNMTVYQLKGDVDSLKEGLSNDEPGDTSAKN